MSSYLQAIRTALFVFPILAAVLTVPYVLYQYRKFGSIPLLRTAVLYSFALYLLTCYFLVILPIPSFEAVEAMQTPIANLIPGSAILEFLEQYPQNFATLGAYWNLLTSSAMKDVIFNVLMLVPLGVYLRYYFEFRWKKAVLCGFFLSLFFELTQLTGLYGFYPRPYRLFDVGDLITNTFGTLLGWLATPLFCFFLPSRQKLDERAYRKGEKVPFLRRVAAFCLDWFFLAVVYAAFHILSEGLFSALIRKGMLVVVALCYVCLWQRFTGATPGKRLMRLRIVSDEGGAPSFARLALRYGLLYGVVLALPVYFMICIRIVFVSEGWIRFIALTMAFLLILAMCAVGAETLMKLFGSKTEFWYGRLSRTHVESTIRLPAQSQEKDR
ncbi:VanZ family protein [uncultured Ruthenibacterium sp.]|uniref:VanZ family protein n=1 Tax=uncultured Ruthenibacterium sp. TaxID=1905347 RepID=UPI00349E90EF